jgi:hypothetical protein
VHAVQGAQESGFAASARPDDGGNSLGRDLKADIRQDLVRAEPNMEMLDVEGDAGSRGGAPGDGVRGKGCRSMLRSGGLALGSHGTHRQTIKMKGAGLRQKSIRVTIG